jgi:succinoglycan biosynthesis transport protein ExoP
MDLGRALAAVRRRWVLLVAVALVGLLAGAGNFLLTPKSYKSTTSVLFSVKGGGSLSELADGNTYVQDLVPSYAKVAEMPIVLQPVINKVGLDTTPAELAGSIEVQLQPASVVLQISATDGNPERAAAIANGVADELAAALVSLSPRSETNNAAMTLTTLSRASPANFPASPNRNLSLAAGLFLGIVLGLVSVAVRESIATPPLATRQDLARVTNLPLLASIATDPRAGQRPIPVSTHPNIARSHSLRILQTNLGGLKEAGALSVAVTSPSPGEGRTGIAVNLAIAMAHTSARTLLVDADVGNHAVAQWLGLDNSVGLTSILKGERSAEQGTQQWVTQLWGDRTVDVVTAGPRVPNPTELLASPPMAEFLSYAREHYEAIVIDTPPLLQSTVGTVLAAQLDGALLVADATRTKERHVSEALGRLRMAGANVLGAVLNRSAQDGPGEYPAARITKARGADAPRQHEAQHDVEASREAPAGAVFAPSPVLPGSAAEPHRRGSEPPTAIPLADIAAGTARPQDDDSPFPLPKPPAPAKPQMPAKAQPSRPHRPAAQSAPAAPAATPSAPPRDQAPAAPTGPHPKPVVAFPGSGAFPVPGLPQPLGSGRTNPADATAPIATVRSDGGKGGAAADGGTAEPGDADAATGDSSANGGEPPQSGRPPRAPERSEASSGG